MRAFSPFPGPGISGWLLFLLLIPSATEAAAQTADISVEVGGSSVSPPAGIDAEDARFLVAGIRGFRLTPQGAGILASFLVGRSLHDANGGDFLSGTIEGTLLKGLGRGWSGGLEVRGFGFSVSDPFPYQSLGVEGGPTLRYTHRYVSASIKGVAGSGWSETELQRTGQHPSQVVRDELWRYGGTGEFLAGSGRIHAGFSLGVHDSSGGTYRSAGLRLIAGGEGPALEVRVDGWETPSGNETTGGLAFVIPLGGWSFRGFLGRTEPDPLTLAEPGGGSGGVLLGRSLVGRSPLPPLKQPLHEILEYSGEGATVEIRVEVPKGAGTVEVIGDFTLWEPVTMDGDGSRRTVRIDVPFGTHHFGFLVDGEWFLPADAPDSVPDDWGRRNTTIVIER